jgi:hypothetical protein
MLLPIFQVICPDMYLAISQALINLVRWKSFVSKEQISCLMCYYKCFLSIICSHWAADYPPLRVWILLPQLWHPLTTTAVQLWPLSQAPLWVIFYQLLSCLLDLSMSLTCFYRISFTRTLCEWTTSSTLLSQMQTTCCSRPTYTQQALSMWVLYISQT